jgi:hypothetical protein
MLSGHLIPFSYAGQECSRNGYHCLGERKAQYC